MTHYYNFNGKLVSADDKIISVSNRAFHYGDGVFESIRLINGKPFNLEAHFNRLVKGAKTLTLKLPGNFTISFFEQQIIDLAKKNSHLPSARIRFTLFRDDGGLYQPSSNNAKYLIESSPLENDNFILNRKGFMVDIYNDNKKIAGTLSELKSCNALIYITAKIYATKNGLDDSLVLNNHNDITEATSSNIFLVKKNNLYTPPVSGGCVDGTMRRLIKEVSTGAGLNYIESPIQQGDLINADELFLTNAVSGIRWVLGFRNKRFFSRVSSLLIKQLNKRIQ